MKQNAKFEAEIRDQFKKCGMSEIANYKKQYGEGLNLQMFACGYTKATQNLIEEITSLIEEMAGSTDDTYELADDVAYELKKKLKATGEEVDVDDDEDFDDEDFDEDDEEDD